MGSPLEQLPTANMTLPLEDMLVLIALIITAVYVIFTAILHYHWKNYATDDNVHKTTLTLYFATTMPLLIVMWIIAWFVI